LPPIGLIAGGGRLPVLIAEALAGADRKSLILAIEGQNCLLKADQSLSLGQVGRMFRALQAAKIKDIVLCGAVSAPDMRNLKLDPRGMMLLPKVMAAANKGEDGLMRCIARIFEDEGYHLVRPDHLVTDLKMFEGTLTEMQPSGADSRDISRGLSELRALGERDKGQACIVKGGEIIAVESEAGTDAMLITCYAPNGGVLVKGPKPDQTLLLDMPVIGPETVYHAAAAGLSGIAVVAGGSLIVDRAAVLDQANNSGIFVTGIDG